ncbi:MAG: hypothetical protein JNK75_00380 [Betaproteobacteria bacterium]|nr:hypothetical protein [Betaproteobacteria bacterium]
MLEFGPAFAQAVPGTQTSLLSIARGSGFAACQREIERIDRNLFSNADYSVRVFAAERNTPSHPWSALVDARRMSGGVLARSLTHVTVTPAAKGLSCGVSYEQTQYHALRCDLVQRQMAPNAQPTPGTSYGALTFDLHRNMSLTVIPVGDAQCVSVLKEVSY